ncbi:RNA polymerase sigma factor [Paraferrimonas sp. SM1919]|uniref:RNA polymerase sigma factor n=1 Tax=Paraferrimonas sp. SM1919 TaxID=2662263 RepID=UPI0013D09EEF|nr:sigma-70 family RNA polymerase sigma factor [Paraferrimonas sp. SM1919]
MAHLQLAPDSLDEAELIRLAAMGDKQAFEKLYRMHVGRVYALCFRLAGEQYLAEELTQGAFVRIWQKLAQFNGDSLFSSWYHTLVVNHCIATLKQQATWWQRFVPIDHHIEAAPVKSMDENQIDALLPKLPERARIIFVLFAIEGHSHQEIGKMLNIHPGTSKGQYHRARTLLQEMLS